MSGNRRLDGVEVASANLLLTEIRGRLNAMAAGDSELLFALRRKVFKELIYDERGKPMDRRKLKRTKRAAQDGKCTQCAQVLPDRYIVLDRFVAAKGYTAENTQLICEPCDRSIQIGRGYA